MVADDNEDARDMLRLVLEQQGYEVVPVEDGQHALDAIAALEPDVAILDIGMPGLDGYEVARRLMGWNRRSRPFLVAFSGFGRPEDKLRAAAAGFDQHFTKPADIDALIRTVEKRLH